MSEIGIFYLINYRFVSFHEDPELYQFPCVAHDMLDALRIFKNCCDEQATGLIDVVGCTKINLNDDKGFKLV